ncbi:putative E3 ubiquitin-protein ligase RF298 [Zingiber officinale]|uniref:putative E3 ubiquitin-protein ligase RF298 n=1 Tax=Zingiber officinale TaxID=94328 RepID=UPI001C4A765C|nr:putative E3 ubiquitin-protein ligase RF298 [Zingiber officinale]
MVSVLMEMRPFISRGNAMWSLLMCDMNLSIACMMDTDTFSSSGFSGISGSSSVQLISNCNSYGPSSLMSECNASAGELNSSTHPPLSLSDETSSLASVPGLPSSRQASSNWTPMNVKDEILVKLLARIEVLKTQLQDWTDWGQQKVMQAARRLNKEKAELQSLRQERDEAAHLLKEKETLEYESLNDTTRRLEDDNNKLRQELEVAKDRWKFEEKGKQDILTLVAAERNEHEQIETSAKLEETAFVLKSESELQKYKEDIRSLEDKISKLRINSYTKTPALTWDMNAHSNTEILDSQGSDNEVQRDRECVMCLTEEMSVVFLPCSHQIVCAKCNELHEKQGMKDCPSCRTPIQRRIHVRST